MASSARDRRSGAAGVPDAVRRARGPAAAAAGVVGGLALGTAVGARLRSHRRPHLLGMPLPRSRELRSVARAGRRLYELESDVRALREQADSARRQSPIEVVLSALTSRRLPRRS